MEIFASSKSMLQVKMLEVIQNRFSGLLPYEQGLWYGRHLWRT